VVKIVVMASFNMDLVMRAERLPRPGETLQGSFAMFLGGKGFNQAVAARRLGAEVSVIGRVGADDFGAAFLDAVDREGIERGGVSVDAERGTGVASIVVDADGENAIIQSPRANRALSADDVRRAAAAIDGATIALFQLELSDAAVYEYARLARSAGATVIFNPAPAAAVADDIVALAEIIVPNQIEACALTGIDPRSIDDAYAAAEALRKRGPAVAVITLGSRGAVAVAEGVRIHIPALGVDVVDTVGAGDAFCAALGVRLAEGADLADAVRFSAAAGAVACTRPGAEPSMPRRIEVEALLAIGESPKRQGAPP
jgi:ribokinase